MFFSFGLVDGTSRLVFFLLKITGIISSLPIITFKSASKPFHLDKEVTDTLYNLAIEYAVSPGSTRCFIGLSGVPKLLFSYGIFSIELLVSSTVHSELELFKLPVNFIGSAKTSSFLGR